MSIVPMKHYSYPIATLRRIADEPQDVGKLPPLSFHKLAHHRAIVVKQGVAFITSTGLRQLRNLS